ncbi:MAG: sigma-70 family RNA polymerase sigma factor [Oscillospiraceae bacterium]|nr:sigma-70 family RNA polymerase sigma factor [Oscillospiraceae bacterium]
MKNRDKLVEDNLGLVHSCCQKFKNRGIEYDDLFSSGCMGLIKAIDNFNPDYGLQLSTYAVPVILGEIKQLFRNGGAVKVSRSLKELSMKINKTSNDFQLKHNRPPTVGELAKILETTKEKINEALNATRLPLSLTTDDEDDIKELDLPCDDEVEMLTEKLALKQVISQLDTTDKKIIELRYYKHQTQTQTAKILNMTQVQVSRREKKILMFMRQKLSV